MKFYIEKDINKIFLNTKDFMKFFNYKNILITGGNGFLG